jgi:phosphoribosylaminoimidazole carboxylase PurK protein
MQQTGTVGIIGGGQLGQMLAQAARPLGFKVTVLDPGLNSPAAQAGAQQIVKPYTEEAINELARQVDFLTTEFEEGLNPEDLEKFAGILNPAPKTIALLLDKVIQKNYLSKNGVAMGEYHTIGSADEAYGLLEKYGGKMLVKTRRGGYDGYGNRLVASRKQVDQALKDFDGRQVYAEAVVPFAKELAVMVVRGRKGDVVTYPVVETIQKNNICHEVLAPAQIDEATKQKALDLAQQAAGSFEGDGAFGIEMFLTKDGKVWLNEVAPRVHNSGHYTIEACQTSQFENHIRAVTGLPLDPTDMKVTAAVMVNILGQYNGEPSDEGLDKASQFPHTYVHIYGKSPNKVGRKMGHITVTADSVEQAKQTAEAARKEIKL